MWYSLPGHVVEGETLGVFKISLDTAIDTFLAFRQSTSVLGKGEHCWAERPVLAITLCYVTFCS